MESEIKNIINSMVIDRAFDLNEEHCSKEQLKFIKNLLTEVEMLDQQGSKTTTRSIDPTLVKGFDSLHNDLEISPDNFSIDFRDNSIIGTGKIKN